MSANRGKTWAIPDPTLASVGDPLAQLFHAVSDPPAPIIQVRDARGILSANLLANPASQPPKQYVSDGVALPGAVPSRLASALAQGRVSTRLKIFSRSALDLRFEGLQLFYDPFSAQGGA